MELRRGVTVPAAGRLKYLFLAWLSKPKGDRRLYRLIRRRRPKRIVELGIADGRRALRMISVATRDAVAGEVSYAGIDLFEARATDKSTTLTLKEAYRRLKATGARIRLAPGDPLNALTRVANELTGTDLLLISAGQDKESLAQAWFYVPRMLHAGSLVMVEEIDTQRQTNVWRQLTIAEVNARVPQRDRRRAA
jgi:predicted O-methyltransferase YrrM